MVKGLNFLEHHTVTISQVVFVKRRCSTVMNLESESNFTSNFGWKQEIQEIKKENHEIHYYSDVI
jgi:hypothetical protein